MQDQILTLVLVLLGLALGGWLGWLAGGRPAADLRVRLGEAEAEVKELDEKIKAFVRDLATESEKAKRVDELQIGLDKAREDNSAIHAKLAKHEANTDHFAEQQRILLEAKDALTQQFEAAGAKVLAGAQEAFLKRAQDRFGESEKINTERLNALLAPVDQRLKSYVDRVALMEAKNADGFGLLTGQIEAMRSGQERVVDGANRIATTLRGATKARGDWGELQLENLLESCGLYDKADFNFQVTVRGDEGNILRPDAILNIPGNRRLVVDVKNVFNTYASANEADSEEERQALLKAHARELRGHIDDLSSKRYQDHVPGSADFVVLFVPGEHVLYAALTQDSGLLDYALKRQIVLSSPLNFMSIALTVSTVWRQAGVQADVEEIAKLGKEIYDRLGIVAGHLGALRKSLYSTNQHFDSLIGSFDTNLRRTGERFEQLNVDTSAQNLNEALPIGHQPRKLSNFADSDEPEAAEQP